MKRTMKVGLVVVAVISILGLLAPSWGSAWAAQWGTNTGSPAGLLAAGTSLQGERAWKVVTLAEDAPCGDIATPAITRSIPTENFTDMIIFRIAPTPQECYFYFQSSPDDTNWFNFGPAGSYQTQTYAVPVSGPFFRIWFNSNTPSGGQTGRHTLKAYLYSDHAIAVSAPPTAATLTSFEALPGSISWIQGAAVLVAGVVAVGAAIGKSRKD